MTVCVKTFLSVPHVVLTQADPLRQNHHFLSLAFASSLKAVDGQTLAEAQVEKLVGTAGVGR